LGFEIEKKEKPYNPEFLKRDIRGCEKCQRRKLRENCNRRIRQRSGIKYSKKAEKDV
jgi:hypothetical protein